MIAEAIKTVLKALTIALTLSALGVLPHARQLMGTKAMSLQERGLMSAGRFNRLLESGGRRH